MYKLWLHLELCIQFDFDEKWIWNTPIFSADDMPVKDRQISSKSIDCASGESETGGGHVTPVPSADLPLDCANQDLKNAALLKKIFAMSLQAEYRV